MTFKFVETAIRHQDMQVTIEIQMPPKVCGTTMTTTRTPYSRRARRLMTDAPIAGRIVV